MFINIHQINRKRNSSLTPSKNQQKIYEGSFKSIGKLQINAINTEKPKEEKYTTQKQNQKTNMPSKTKNKQNLSIKVLTKRNPLKLQNPSQNLKSSQSTLQSLLQNQNYNEIKCLVQTQMIRTIIQNRLATQYNPSVCIFKTNDFCKFLQKVIMNFTEKDKDQLQDDFSFLNGLLKEIKNIVNSSNKVDMIKRNKLRSQFGVINEYKSYSESLKHQASELQSICIKKFKLLEEYSLLQQRKASVLEHNMIKIKQIEAQNAEINKNLQKIALQQQKILNLNQEIKKKQNFLQELTSKTDKVLHYIQNQSTNKIIILAAEQYKHIESQIYEYAVYLQANELANSFVYESIPTKYYNSVIDGLDDSLKVINKNIIQNDEMSIQDKAKSMRDFVLKMHDAYKKKDNEMQKAFYFKTKCINNFVNMMKKWLDNWTLKQEYLVNLRGQFVADTSAYEEIMKTTKAHISHYTNPNIEREYQSLNRIYDKIKENYLLGNSFY